MSVNGNSWRLALSRTKSALGRKNRKTSSCNPAAAISSAVSFGLEGLETRQLLAAPIGPSNFAVVNATPSTISLSWTDNANNETAFQVERLVNGNWSAFANLPANTTSFTDSGLAAGTAYAYRVHALNADGNSHYGFIGNAVTTTAVASTPPFAPYFLSAVANSSTQVTLNWFDNAGVETGVKVERKTGNGAFAVIATLAPHAQTHIDTTATAGTAYTYRVASFNNAGPSPYTNESSATTSGTNGGGGGGSQTGSLAAPFFLSASNGSGANVNLKWFDNNINENNVYVERATGNGAFAVIATLAPATVAYTDTTGASGTFYTYRVNAGNNSGNSPYSNTSSAITGTGNGNGGGNAAPAAPFFLSASGVTSTSVTLNWFNGTGVPTAINVERSTGNGAFSQIATLAPGVQTYADTSVSGGTFYTYRLTASNAAGPSPYSNTTSAQTSAGAGGLPAAPTNLQTGTYSGSQINMIWADNASNETGFTVERQTGGGAFAAVANLPANTTTYQDTGLAVNTSYTYRVRANNGAGPSGNSNTSTAQTSSGAVLAPVPPSNLQAAVISSSEIDLSWNDNTLIESNYIVERLNGAVFQVIATLPANSNSYKDLGLTQGTSYTYRISASNIAGPSAITGPISATTTSIGPVTPPAAPTFLSAAAISGTQIGLSWGDNANNETGYVVERQNGPGFIVLATLPANSTFLTDTGLSLSTSYTYRVVAVNTAGPSAYSNLSSATTSSSNGGGGARTDLTTFFPIGVFQQPVNTIDQWKARGINTLVSYEDYGSNTTIEQWTQIAKDRGLKYIRQPLANPALDISDPDLLSWLNPVDEPELATGAAFPAAVAQTATFYNSLKAVDPTRPISTTYAGGFVLGWLADHPKADFDQLLVNTDWNLPCIYPVSGWNLPAQLNAVGQLIDRSQEWYPTKRVMAYIETSNQALPWIGPAARGATASEVRGEIWNSIVHGATGVIYFPQRVYSGFAYDATPADVVTLITAENAKINQIGAALLSPENPAGRSLSGLGNIETCWRVYNGHTYLIALNLSPNPVSNAALATTGFSAGQTFSVLGEGRNVTLSGTTLIDNFQPNEAHIYVL